MTFTLQLATITSAIAGLTISGVTIKDTNLIAESWKSLPAVLYPNPNADGFITGFNIEYEKYISDLLSPITASYDLHYRYLDSQIGDMANFSAAYGQVATRLATILNALVEAANDVADIDIKVGEVSIGNKQDPAGNQYHGADFALNIVERYKDL